MKYRDEGEVAEAARQSRWRPRRPRPGDSGTLGDSYRRRRVREPREASRRRRGSGGGEDRDLSWRRFRARSFVLRFIQVVGEGFQIDPWGMVCPILIYASGVGVDWLVPA